MFSGCWPAVTLYAMVMALAILAVPTYGRHGHKHSKHDSKQKGPTIQLGAELLPLINHLRQQQLAFATPLTWLPPTSGTSPPPEQAQSLLGSLLSTDPLSQLVSQFAPSTPPISTISNPRHFGRHSDGEMEVSATALKAHQDPQRVLFSLMEAFWSKTLSECVQCFPAAPAAPGQQPQQQCQVKPPEG